MGKELHPLTMHILYGDIHEMPLDVLHGEVETEDGLDSEQACRVACAATVQAWIEGRLHRAGFKWDESAHRLEDRVVNILEVRR